MALGRSNMDKSNYITKSRNSQSLPFFRVALPKDHRFFEDCLRENNARLIQWSITRPGFDAWFVTQTFKDFEYEASAKRLFRTWAGRLGQALIDSGGGQLRWVLATEWQKRNVIHLHGLVQGKELGIQSRKSWECRWESLTLNTGFCRIYDADKKAAPYLAKYTSKRLGGELERGGYWRGLETPSSVACIHSR